MKSPQNILNTVFGYDIFRPMQQEIIENVLRKRDTLAVLPTGGGKSLCYQIPSLINSGLTVVVSPLIALMKDQVEQMRAFGIPALFLNSSLSPANYAAAIDHLKNREARLLYVSPETLLTPRLFTLLDELSPELITIDEAHCISEWGHDFRPEYRRLFEVRQRYSQAVCLALTATATPRVRSDIKSSLGFSSSTFDEFVASFNRENLYIEVRPKEDAVEQIIHFLRRFVDQSGIIYCFSRRQVETLSAYLEEKGFRVRPYHAGLGAEERRRNQEAFIHDDIQIMVATIAFGMGINKPNVRFVIHHDLPKSIESYYQEIGRAGRDGLPAHCLLLFSYSDISKQRYFIDQKDGIERQVAIEHLNAMVHYAEEDILCRRQPLLKYFGENTPVTRCNQCDNCHSAPPKLINVTIPAQKFMSCVVRTGQRFGISYIIDVLRGSKKEKIIKNNHHELSTYQIGTEWSENQWKELAIQLIKMGYLSQDSQHLSLSLTPVAVEALRNRSTISICQQKKQPPPSEKDDRQIQSSAIDKTLLDHLRQQRKQLAGSEGVPPYAIFPDKTLQEMASLFPQSLKSMENIFGVGHIKLEKYAPTFLSIILPYCDEHKILDRTNKKNNEKKRHRSIKKREDRSIQIGQSFNEGTSIETISENYHIKISTVFEHLNRYIKAGNRLSRTDELQKWVSTNNKNQQDVYQAFDELSTEKLKPVFEKLNQKVNYDDLKILRCIYLTSTKND